MNAVALAEQPKFKQLLAQNESIASQVHAIVVDSPETYATACDKLKRIKGALAQVEEERFAITRPMDEEKKKVMDLFGPLTQALKNFESSIKSKLTRYDDEQRRIAAEAQRRADEEARKAREKAEREAAETRRKAEEKAAAERAAAEAARVAGDLAEAQKLEAKAAKIEERAEAKAEEKLAVAVSIVAPIIEAPKSKVAGISSREIWRFEIVDESKIPRQFMIPDVSKITKLVNALKAEASLTIPGIRVFSEKSIASSKS